MHGMARFNLGKGSKYVPVQRTACWYCVLQNEAIHETLFPPNMGYVELLFGKKNVLISQPNGVVSNEKIIFVLTVMGRYPRFNLRSALISPDLTTTKI